MADQQPRPTLPDQQHRERIANDLETTMLVEAAAGTGKTTCLVGRMVGLLRSGKCRVESLAAVTFTRKAAAELRTRFQLAIEQESGTTDEEQRRLATASAGVERCFIGTIHSFCARILRERPVEAGVDPGFIELDEAIDQQLREQAWREHVATLITTDDPILPELQTLGLKLTPSTKRSNSLVSELDELGLEPAELGPAFMNFAKFPDVTDWPAAPVPLPNLAACCDEVHDYLIHMQSLEFPDDRGNDKLMSKYEAVCRRAELLDLQKPVQLMELLEEFDSSAGAVLSKWPEGMDQGRAERDRWADFRTRIVQPTLQDWREHRYEPVIRAIRPAIEVYDRLRRDRNALNYQDLLILTARLLRSDAGIRRYFRHRFTHLLVDEFQDTDPIQAEIMLLLTADNLAEPDWQKCRPAPGSLFVVGDPKQSIYRFRRADIVTYNRVRSIIETVGGTVVPLTTNFRSTRPVIEWINQCFSTVFPSAVTDHSPADRPLDVGRLEEAPSDSGVQRLPAPDSRANLPPAEFDADRIARFIRRAVDQKWPIPRTESERKQGLPEHAQPGDFLLVTRDTKRLTAYARTLQGYGLPHSVTGGGVLNSVPELELLSLCVTALVRPDDSVALVSVLRSELFGVADTALFEFRQRGGHFSFYSEIPEDVRADKAEPLRDAFLRMQRYATWLRQMPASAAIEKVASHLGLIARACAAEEGDAHAGSLLKAIELLRAADTGVAAGDASEMLARLVAGEDSYDGTVVRPPEEKPVRVMNLHQCKGLEAPFVFLVDPSGVWDHGIAIHIDRSGEQPHGYLPIYGRPRGKWKQVRPLLAHPPGWDQLAANETRFLAAEAQRLLYVAATRAGFRLVISQRDGKGNQSKNPWQIFDAHLTGHPDFPDPGPATTSSSESLPFDSEDWRSEVTRINNRWQASRTPSYAVQAIKESAIRAGEKPHGAEKQGAEWGQAIHTLLETAMKHPGQDLRKFALAALQAEELPLELLDRVLETVGQVLDSDIWRRAQSSARCLTEVPLAMAIENSSTGSSLPAIRRGVIDLIFREQAGWVIVDYKSERVDADALPAIVAYYEPQIRAYIQVWEAIVGEPVIEAGLFFTHPGSFIQVETGTT